jgi:hypothetical protein
MHPRWGRQLDQYASSYGVDAAEHILTLDLGLPMDALESVRKISALATGSNSGHINSIDSTEQITLPILRSVLTLARSPHTFHCFAHPSLISGCITLMATVKLSGKHSVSS